MAYIAACGASSINGPRSSSRRRPGAQGPRRRPRAPRRARAPAGRRRPARPPAPRASPRRRPVPVPGRRSPGSRRPRARAAARASARTGSSGASDRLVTDLRVGRGRHLLLAVSNHDRAVVGPGAGCPRVAVGTASGAGRHLGDRGEPLHPRRDAGHEPRKRERRRLRTLDGAGARGTGRDRPIAIRRAGLTRARGAAATRRPGRGGRRGRRRTTAGPPRDDRPVRASATPATAWPWRSSRSGRTTEPPRVPPDRPRPGRPAPDRKSRCGPMSFITSALPPPAAITAAPTSALPASAAPIDSLGANNEPKGKRRSSGSGSRKPRWLNTRGSNSRGSTPVARA